ncbi:MAG: leucine-rich repeat domain-containing protein [Bacteroidaceae bacterium]|nr:leucine-rich repeat domain-containing protein [Bacteroidaceae bacterium]
MLDEVQQSEPIIIDSGKAGNTSIWTLDNNGHLRISGSGAMYDYVDGNRPDYIERHPHEIKSITVEEGITKIGASAFTGTPAKEAWIGPDVSEIGNSAFAGCHGLDNIVVPSNVEKIGANAFYNSGLSNILLCEGVKEVGSSAFAYCSELSAICLPSSVEQVGDYAFSYTGAIINTYNPEMIPESAVWGEEKSPVIDANEWNEEDVADGFGDPAEWK